MANSCFQISAFVEITFLTSQISRSCRKNKCMLLSQATLVILTSRYIFSPKQKSIKYKNMIRRDSL